MFKPKKHSLLKQAKIEIRQIETVPLYKAVHVFLQQIRAI